MNECILKILNWNLKLSECSKRNLRKHKAILRKVTDKGVFLTAKKRLIDKREVFLIQLQLR